MLKRTLLFALALAAVALVGGCIFPDDHDRDHRDYDHHDDYDHH